MEEKIGTWEDDSGFVGIRDSDENTATKELASSKTLESNPNEIDIFTEIKKANFLPLMYLCKVNPSTNLNVHDDHGFTAMHYAVCYGNSQVQNNGN